MVFLGAKNVLTVVILFIGIYLYCSRFLFQYFWFMITFVIIIENVYYCKFSVMSEQTSNLSIFLIRIILKQILTYTVYGIRKPKISSNYLQI